MHRPDTSWQLPGLVLVAAVRSSARSEAVRVTLLLTPAQHRPHGQGSVVQPPGTHTRREISLCVALRSFKVGAHPSQETELREPERSQELLRITCAPQECPWHMGAASQKRGRVGALGAG